jgi:hypothetical protein
VGEREPPHEDTAGRRPDAALDPAVDPVPEDAPDPAREDAPDPALDEALEALAAPGRLREAEARVARIAPRLQRILATALQEGGWFDEAHQSEVLKAATKPDPEERIAAVRTLVAEEARLGMMVGVAVGWELAREVDGDGHGA